jgi:hypothetical protein
VGVCFIVEKKKKGNRKQRRGGEESVCGGHETGHIDDNTSLYKHKKKQASLPVVPASSIRVRD